VAGARASGGEGAALTARAEREAEPSGPFTRFGKANIAGLEVVVPVLVLLGVGLLSLAGGLLVALRRRGAFGGMS
jgi:hypothetical protein